MMTIKKLRAFIEAEIEKLKAGGLESMDGLNLNDTGEVVEEVSGVKYGVNEEEKERKPKLVILAGDTNVAEMDLLVTDMVRDEELMVIAERGAPLSSTIKDVVEKLDETEDGVEKYVILYGGAVDVLHGALRETKMVEEIKGHQTSAKRERGQADGVFSSSY